MRRATTAAALLSVLVAACGGGGAGHEKRTASPPALTPAPKPSAPPTPAAAARIANGLTVAQVSDRLGGPREIKPTDKPDCLYWTTTDSTKEIEVCFSAAAVSRSTSARLVPATP